MIKVIVLVVLVIIALSVGVVDALTWHLWVTLVNRVGDIFGDVIVFFNCITHPVPFR